MYKVWQQFCCPYLRLPVEQNNGMEHKLAVYLRHNYLYIPTWVHAYAWLG